VTLSTATSLVLRLAGIAIGMGTTALLSRMLAPAGYGELSLAMTLVTAAAQTADLGIAITSAARIAREGPVAAGRTLSTALALRTTTAFIAGLVLVGLAIAGVLGPSSGIITIAAIATPLSAVTVLTAGSTARFRPEIQSILLLLQGALWFVAVVAVHRTGGALVALAWSFVVVTLLQTLAGLFLNRRVVALGRPSTRQAWQMLAGSWPLAVSAIAYTAYYRLDAAILFHARGATELGLLRSGVQVHRCRPARADHPGRGAAAARGHRVEPGLRPAAGDPQPGHPDRRRHRHRDGRRAHRARPAAHRHPVRP
jgi:O-antigen/teichoic acid export membrane protein